MISYKFVSETKDIQVEENCVMARMCNRQSKNIKIYDCNVPNMTMILSLCDNCLPGANKKVLSEEEFKLMLVVDKI